MKFSPKSSANLESIARAGVDAVASEVRGEEAIEGAITISLAPKSRNWFLTAVKSKASSDGIIFYINQSIFY